MIVLDASAVVELVTGGPRADAVRKALAGKTEALVVPHVLDVEVLSALRGLSAGQRVDSDANRQRLAALARLPAIRYPHGPLLERIWDLRRNHTSCDAAYIALAERMNATLYTCDAKLLRGHNARVRLIPGWPLTTAARLQ